MKKNEIQFEDSTLDDLLMSWLKHGITQPGKKEWETLLTYNSDFREKFCDWIKALRHAEPSTKGQKVSS